MFRAARLPGVALVFVLAVPIVARARESVVGVALPLTGPLQEEGEMLRNALEVFVEDVNRKGGIQGQRVSLRIRDDQDKPDVAKAVASEMAADPAVLAVIGHYNSSTVLGAADVYDKSKLVLATPVTTNPETAAASPYIFNVNYSGIDEGAFIAGYLQSVLKKQRVAVLRTDHRYGQRLMKGFSARASRIGLSIVREASFAPAAGAPADMVAREICTAKPAPDAVVLFTHTEDGLKLIQQVRSAPCEDVKNLLIFGPETFVTPRFLDTGLAEVMRDVYVTSPFFYEVSNELSFRFRTAYLKKYKKEPELKAALVIDAAQLILEAIAQKGATREGIRDFLATRRRANNADSIMAATGDLFFGAERSVARDVFVAHVRDGRYKIAFTQLATVKEGYVLKQLPERIAKGYIAMIDEVPYHIVDVVFVGLDISRINDIDPTGMRFEAEFFLWFKWTSDAIDTASIAPINAIYTEESQNNLFKENLSKEIRYRAYQVRASFINTFNLRDFPNDTQSLSIQLAHKNRNNTHILLVPDSRHMTENPLDTIYPLEWDFVIKNNWGGLYRYDSTFGDPDYRMGAGHKSKIYFSTVNFEIVVKRILRPYIFSLFLPLLILIGISLVVFLIPLEDFEIKLNTSMTALLSLLVLNLSQNDSMPRVAYLMKVDYFFLSSYVLLFALILEIICINLMLRRGKEVLARRTNRAFSLLFGPAAVACYLFLLYGL